MTEKFHLVNGKKLFCPQCFKESETASKVGYKETKYFLYDLWEAWQNKTSPVMSESYMKKTHFPPDSKETSNSSIQQEREKTDINYWPWIIASMLGFVAIISLIWCFFWKKTSRKLKRQ